MTTIRAASALLALSALVAIDLVTIDVRQAAAETYRPWCVQYTGRSGGSTNCGFTSFEQCMLTARGAGGHCVQNPWYLQYGQGGQGSAGKYSAGKYQDKWR